MTVDERIEALLKSVEAQKERHDALAQSLEWVASIQRDNETEMATIQKNSDARLAKLDEYFVAMMQSMMRLSNIATVHDMHINEHEHRIGDLEQGR